MVKWRRRASHLDRFTLWHNGCRATQLGKFTLWHNGRRTKPGLMHAPVVADIFQRQWRTMLKNMKVKFNSKLLKDEPFGRFSNHRSMYALRRFSKLFERWTLYEEYQTLANLWKVNAEDTRITTWIRKVRQNLSKRLKAGQMYVDDDDERNGNLRKNLPY